MIKKIRYYFKDERLKEDFSLAKKHIPDWYRDVPLKHSNEVKFPIPYTVKACVPFLDAIISGYYILTSADLAIHQGEIESDFDITWNQMSDDLLRVAIRNVPYGTPIPDGYRSEHLIWENKCIIKLPKGYSALITHPLNRYDLPFLTTSGIADIDKNLLTVGSLPFYLKKGFSGVIPKGTPIAQVIPIKRNRWIKSFDKKLSKENDNHLFNVNNISGSYYKKNSWNRKEYE